MKNRYLYKDIYEVQLPKMAICNGSEIESVAHNGKIFAKFQLSLTQNASNLTNKQWQINHYIFISMILKNISYLRILILFCQRKRACLKVLFCKTVQDFIFP